MESDMLGNPFDIPGRWYKAALHVHTTDSDGNSSPQDTVKLYADMGFDLVCLTDHDGTEHLPESQSGMLVVPGAELGLSGRCDYHLVILGLERPRRYRPDDVGSLLQLGHDRHVAIVLAHPSWSHLTLPDIMAIDGLSAVEVYNSGCDREVARGFSDSHWDEILDTGRCLWGIAVDDGHVAIDDIGRGWAMLKLRERTRESLVESLRNGWFYSSTGIAIRKLTVEQRRISVLCDPVARIDFVAGPKPGQGKVVCSRSGISLIEAAFEVRADFTGWVRVQCVGADGRRAWTNPFRCEKGTTVQWSYRPQEWQRGPQY